MNMNRTAAFLISSALLLPGAVATAAPANADWSPSGDGAVGGPGPSTGIGVLCHKHKYGHTVRIGMFDDGERIHFKVSHPRGHGRYHAPWVKYVMGDVGGGDSGGAFRDRWHRLRPSFSYEGTTLNSDASYGIRAVFHLRHHRHIRLNCSIG
jgi:hypothetical protein